MAEPLTSVDICNLALDHLSEAPIESIDTPTTNIELLCARWYDTMRQTCLREYVWNFAKSRRVLPRTGTPPFDYTDTYLLPNDCLRVLSIGGENEVSAILDFDIDGRDLLCNANTANSLNLRYIRDEDNVVKFDSLFVNVLALRLAMSMAFKISKKNTVRDSLSKLLAEDLLKASTVDGQERPPKRIQRSKFLAARTNLGSTNVADRYTRFD